MQLVFVSSMASVLRFLLCRRNVLPSCLESQSGYGFSMSYLTRMILVAHKQDKNEAGLFHAIFTHRRDTDLDQWEQ